jgi:hypothetical protein
MRILPAAPLEERSSTVSRMKLYVGTIHHA